VAWIAPRGILAAAVAGVFGPQLQAQGYTGADFLLPLVFALIFVTVVVHGFILRPLAQRLDLCTCGPTGVLIVGSNAWTVGLAQALQDGNVQFNSPEQELKPKSGDAVIGFGPKPEN
jgi:NhaP-type Na+/H+ or K+/H+ antiporter